MYDKGFVALCCASINYVTLWKVSAQCHVIGVFQTGAQNLEMVTFQNRNQIMRRVAKYHGHLSAGSVLGCSSMHRARVSDFLILIFAI